LCEHKEGLPVDLCNRQLSSGRL